MHVHVEYDVPGIWKTTVHVKPTRTVRQRWFRLELGTFGHLRLKDFAAKLPSICGEAERPWLWCIDSQWFLNLAGLARAAGSSWPSSCQTGIVALSKPRIRRGRTNYYGHHWEISLIQFRADLKTVEKSMETQVFLSHKGSDKPLVRRFADTLRLMGYQPWLDEDALVAGVELERGILRGFAESCAAVFFVTSSFKDEQYLATEVNYAIAERRRKGERFQIITLVLVDRTGKKGLVPDLLSQFVWKEPTGELQALQEILRALPVAAGPVAWRKP
jgi:hypothetical protein